MIELQMLGPGGTLTRAVGPARQPAGLSGEGADVDPVPLKGYSPVP